MINYKELYKEVLENVPAYKKFLHQESQGSEPPIRFEDLPLLTKQKYLLTYPIADLCRSKDMDNIHLIGASSGFSKTGAIFWPKRPCDEAEYMNSIAKMLDLNYGIGSKRTLIIECLAFGMWIGGMQIAAALRNIALSGKYHLTIATPGLDLKAASTIIRDYKDIFDQILIITNPSNITLFSAILNDMNVDVPSGMIRFPVVGEYYTESFREHVARSFGHPYDDPYVVWTGYGSADTGDLGVETKSTIQLRKFFFHHPDISEKIFHTKSTPMLLALSNNAYIEVIDGNLVVTKDQFIPLIRYNTNDAGGLIEKSSLRNIIDEPLYNMLPDKILYVSGRVNNAVIFYGTNLLINDLSEFLLSLPDDKCYGGLFTVHERTEQGVSCLDFTIYVTKEDVDAQWYLNSLIHFLNMQSSEFAIKYQNLSNSIDIPLITVKTSDIKKIDTKVKHKYIV